MNGKEETPSPRRRWKKWLGIWWVSWFGIIGGFLLVGIDDLRYETPTASHSPLALIIVTIGAWIVLFVIDGKIRKRIDGEKNWEAMVNLLTIMGTLLAVFTILGIGFFVSIAPRVK